MGGYLGTYPDYSEFWVPTQRPSGYYPWVPMPNTVEYSPRYCCRGNFSPSKTPKIVINEAFKTVIITTTANMSNSSLSPARSMSLPPTFASPMQLPPLLPSPSLPPAPAFVLPTIPCTQLPPTTSTLYSKNLYTRTLLDTKPPTIQVRCTQYNCTYAPSPRPLLFNTTSNLWKHYENSHPQIYRSAKNDTSIQASQPSSSQTSDSIGFFAPRVKKPQSNTTNNQEYKSLFLIS